MDQQGTPAPMDIIYCAMQRCTKLRDLGTCRHMHSLIVIRGLDSDAFWGDHLIRLYTLCGSLLEANHVFSRVSRPTVYTWNALISAHAKLGKSGTAITFYETMKQDGVAPDVVTFLYILKACSNIRSIGQGRLIHHEIIKSQMASDVIIGNTLVDMYAKCESLEEAGRVFDTLLYQDMVSWSAIIAGCVQHGHDLYALELYDNMLRESVNPGRVTFLSLLKACGSIRGIEQGRLVHNELLRIGLDTDIAVGNTLVDMYAKCGKLKEAKRLFDKLQNPDAVSWAAIIAGYAMHARGFLVIELFEKMQVLGIQPNKVTLSCILKACSKMGAIWQGRLIHDLIIKNGLNSDLAVGSTLVDMYAKCGWLDEACKVFDELPTRDVVSWGAMISGLTQHGHNLSAFKLFEKMEQEGIKPSKVTFSCILRTCASVAAILQGRLMHGYIVRCGLELEVVVGNSLIDMYVKCNSLEEARKVLDELPCKDEVSWGTMIAGYGQHEYGCFALELVEIMQEESIKPGKITVLCILKACGSIGAIGRGRWIHEHVIQSGFDADSVIGNSLLDMYSKCGSLEDAGKLFEKLSRQDVVSWGSMIAGYAVHGNCRLVGQYIERMLRKGLRPDGIIFTSILTACSHAGLPEEGLKYFTSMREDYGIRPSFEHYSCIVNLLGRAGCLSHAEDFLKSMPIEPEVILWRSLLTSCRTYSNVDIGLRCFHEIIRLDPADASGYVLMSNMYVDTHMWDSVEGIGEMRKCAGGQKKPGRAWIEVSYKLHQFVVGGNRHPQRFDINVKLIRLSRLMKRGELVPSLDLMMEPMMDEGT